MYDVDVTLVDFCCHLGLNAFDITYYADDGVCWVEREFSEKCKLSQSVSQRGVCDKVYWVSPTPIPFEAPLTTYEDMLWDVRAQFADSGEEASVSLMVQVSQGERQEQSVAHI